MTTTNERIMNALYDYLTKPAGGWGETQQALRRLEDILHTGYTSAGASLYRRPAGQPVKDLNRAIIEWEAEVDLSRVHPSWKF